MLKKSFSYFLVMALIVTSIIGFNYSTVSAYDNNIVAIDWTRFTASYPTDTNAVIEKNVSEDAMKYAVNTWYTTKYGSQSGVTYLDFGGTAEANIRYPAMEAVSIATSIKLGIYNAAYTGVSQTDALAICAKLVRSLAYRHKANFGATGWGNDWQSAVWAAMGGLAGWMILDQFNTTDKEYIRKMVEYEANRFNNYTVPYYKDRNGNIIYAGDSKAEENAWNSDIMYLACAMMPNHGNYSVWYNKALELSISAFAEPADVNSSTVINGKALSSWLNGSNANADGTVTNHSIIHPDYMCAETLNLINATIFTLAGKPTPKAVTFNTDKVYQALVDLNFSVPPYNSPGGTIYVDGAYSLYFPQGTDWGTGRMITYGGNDSMIHAYAMDTAVSANGTYWEGLHSGRARDMQDRFTDGHMYLDNTEFNYAGKEEQAAWENAQAVLAKWTVLQDEYSITNAAGSNGVSFTEGFENGFGAWTAVGTPTTSTAIKHGGSNSYTINEDMEYITHSMGGNYNQRVDIWYYDDAADTSVECVANVYDGTNARLIGVRTTTNATKYVYRIDSTYYSTAINRTTGWHKLTWDYTSGTDVKMYIDDNLIATAAGLTYFNQILLGDAWTGVTSTTCFDDVSVYTPFTEGFENGFGAWTAVGTPTTSTAIKHGGSNSYAINEDTDNITHIMDGNYNQRVDMWYYDDATDTSVECCGNVHDGVNARLIGVRTATNATKYVYRIDSTYYSTTINRTTGWHKFTWDYTSGTDVKMYIDDSLITTATGLTYFNQIIMGDFWTGVTSTAYFDDIRVY